MAWYDPMIFKGSVDPIQLNYFAFPLSIEKEGGSAQAVTMAALQLFSDSCS